MSSAFEGCRDFRVAVLVGELDVAEPRDRVEVSFLTGKRAEVALNALEGVKHLIPSEIRKGYAKKLCQFKRGMYIAFSAVKNSTIPLQQDLCFFILYQPRI